MSEQQKIKSICDVLAKSMPDLNDKAREELAKKIVAKEYDSRISENLKLSDVSDKIAESYIKHHRLEDTTEISKACGATATVVEEMNDGHVSPRDLETKNRLHAHLSERIDMLEQCIAMYKYSNNPKARKMYKELEAKMIAMKKILLILKVSTKSQVDPRPGKEKERKYKKAFYLAMLKAWENGKTVPQKLEQRLGIITQSMMTESVAEAMVQQRLQKNKKSPREMIAALRGLSNDAEKVHIPEELEKKYTDRVLFALANTQNSVTM